MKSMYIKQGILFLLLFMLESCTSTMTNKAIEYVDNLKKSIDKFEQKRKDLDNSIGIGKISVTEKYTCEAICDCWETTLSKIEDDFRILEKSFKKVDEESKSYFVELNELSSGILDDSLKKQELEKNLVLQTKWDKSYDEAKKTIQEFKTQLRNAQYIKRVLIANLMREDIREKISNNIAELKHFTISTKLLIDELKKFTISCNNNIN